MNPLRSQSYKAGYKDGFEGKPKTYYGPFGKWEIPDYIAGYVEGVKACPPHVRKKN